MLERRYRRTKLQSDRSSWIDNEKQRHKTYRAKENAYLSMWVLRTAVNLEDTGILSTILGSTGNLNHDGSSPAQELPTIFYREGRSCSPNNRWLNTRVIPGTTCISRNVKLGPSRRLSGYLRRCPVRWTKFHPTFLKSFWHSCCLLLFRCVARHCRKVAYNSVSNRKSFRPRIKKARSDVSEVKNCPPISNLTYMSKVVERFA